MMVVTAMMGDSADSMAARATTLWQSGGSIPSVEMMIASITGGTASERTAAVLVDQKFRWKSGIEVSAEHYLHCCPDLAADPDSRLKIAIGEFHARGGQERLVPELVRRFPDLEQALRDAAAARNPHDE